MIGERFDSNHSSSVFVLCLFVLKRQFTILDVFPVRATQRSQLNKSEADSARLARERQRERERDRQRQRQRRREGLRARAIVLQQERRGESDFISELWKGERKTRYRRIVVVVVVKLKK